MPGLLEHAGPRGHLVAIWGDAHLLSRRRYRRPRNVSSKVYQKKPKNLRRRGAFSGSRLAARRMMRFVSFLSHTDAPPPRRFALGPSCSGAFMVAASDPALHTRVALVGCRITHPSMVRLPVERVRSREGLGDVRHPLPALAHALAGRVLVLDILLSALALAHVDRPLHQVFNRYGLRPSCPESRWPCRC